MVVRTIAITYNSYSIPNQIDKFNLRETYNDVSFTVDFVIQASTPTNLVTACNTAEAALREKNKDLAVTFGGGSEYSFSHSSNTGMLAWPTIEKIADELSTETSRHYRFSVRCERPADQSGYGYRRDGQVTIAYDIWQRLTASFSGTYTAGSSNSAYTNYANGTTGAYTWAAAIATAILGSYDVHSLGTYSYEMENKILNFSNIVFKQREQYINIAYDAANRRVVTLSGSFSASGATSAWSVYQSNCATWASSVLSDIDSTATFELISKKEDYEGQKKFLRFNWVYQEIIADEVSGGYSDAVQDADISFSYDWPQRVETSIFAPNGSASQPATASVSFSCWIDQNKISSNDEGEEIYRTQVRPHVLSRIKQALNTGSHGELGAAFIVQGESFQWNESRHRVSGTISIMCPKSNTIEFAESVSQTADPGTTYEKLWDGVDDTYALWGVGSQLHATQNVREVTLDSPPGDPQGLGGNWRAITSWSKDESAEAIGYPGSALGSSSVSAHIRYTSVFRRNYLYVSPSGSAPNSITTTPNWGGGNITATPESMVKADINLSTGEVTISGAKRSK